MGRLVMFNLKYFCVSVRPVYEASGSGGVGGGGRRQKSRGAVSVGSWEGDKILHLEEAEFSVGEKGGQSAEVRQSLKIR